LGVVVTVLVVRDVVVKLVMVVVEIVLVTVVVVAIVVATEVLVVGTDVVVDVVAAVHIFQPWRLIVLSLDQVMSPIGTTLLGPVLPL